MKKKCSLYHRSLLNMEVVEVLDQKCDLGRLGIVDGKEDGLGRNLWLVFFFSCPLINEETLAFIRGVKVEE